MTKLPFTEEQFWSVIDSCHDFDKEIALNNLSRALSELEPLQLKWFDYYFSEKFALTNTWPLRQYISFLCVCTDDGFSNFRSWLVLRGRERFEKAISDPDSLSHDLRRYVNVIMEGTVAAVVSDLLEEVGEVSGNSPPEPNYVTDLAGDYIEDEEMPNRFPIAQKEFRDSGMAFNPWPQGLIAP